MLRAGALKTGLPVNRQLYEGAGSALWRGFWRRAAAGERDLQIPGE